MSGFSTSFSSLLNAENTCGWTLYVADCLNEHGGFHTRAGRDQRPAWLCSHHDAGVHRVSIRRGTYKKSYPPHTQFLFFQLFELLDVLKE